MRSPAESAGPSHHSSSPPGPFDTSLLASVTVGVGLVRIGESGEVVKIDGTGNGGEGVTESAHQPGSRLVSVGAVLGRSLLLGSRTLRRVVGRALVSVDVIERLREAHQLAQRRPVAQRFPLRLC